jgi:magnesium-transporting ATPase (P-type)
MTASKDLQVGDIIQINDGERVPADIVLLKTTEK